MTPNIENIKLMALIEEYNMMNKIESDIKIDSEGTLLTMTDLVTGKPIGIIRGTNLEDAYAKMFTKMVSHVRLIKMPCINNDRLSVL